MQSKDKQNEETEELIKKIKRDRIIKIILIIIIIILLLLWWLFECKIGKIGYQVNETSVAPYTEEENDEMVVINVTSGDIDWDKDTELDIFNNEKFNRRKNDSTRVKWNI